MQAIGLDVHKARTMVCVLDTETGELAEPYAVPTAELVAHLAALPGAPKVAALEAGSQSAFLARRLGTCGVEPHVVHPFRVRRLLEALCGLKKTDKIDARGLAEALAAGLLKLAEVWVPDQALHELRALTRGRQDLVEDGVRLRNLIRKLLVREGADCPFTDLLGVQAQQWLEEWAATMPAAIASVLTAYRQSLAVLHAEQERLSAEIATLVREHTEVRRLQTIPGIGVQLAASIVAEMGPVQRFATAVALRGYSGLVPKVEQSGERCHYGPLTKVGNRRLRRALVLAAQLFVGRKATHELSLYPWYWQQVVRHGRNPAKVAVARRLLNIIFALRRDQTDFAPERYAVVAG